MINKNILSALFVSSFALLNSTTSLSAQELYIKEVYAPKAEIVAPKIKQSTPVVAQAVTIKESYTPSKAFVASPKTMKEQKIITPTATPKAKAGRKDYYDAKPVAAAKVNNSEDAAFRDALVATYENNPRIIAQRSAFEASGEGFNEALAGWLPTINAGYQKGRRRNKVGIRDWQYLPAESKTLNASQPLLQIDTYYALGQADSLIKQSGAQLIGTTQQVLLDTITRYLDVVRDREILMLSRNNVTVLKQQLEATKERFELGEATKTDLAQSEARLSRAESDAIQAMGALAITESSFARLTGFKPSTDFDYPQKVPAIPDNMEAVIAASLEQNPNLLAAKYGEQAADDAVGVNSARLLPTADLQGSVSRSAGSFLGDFDTDQVIVNVDIPLYQGGADYSRIREAKLVKNQRRYETLDATNQAREEAITSWENYQTTLAAIEAQKININAAEIALDGVKQEQLYGSRTVLDVLDAEQELFAAKVTMERSERNLLVSLYSILNVIGQLSPATLALGVEEYDQVEAISDIKYQIIGF